MKWLGVKFAIGILKYKYLPSAEESLPPSAGREFTVSLKLLSLENRTIQHSVEGANLTLKHPSTRGQTMSSGGLADSSPLLDDVILNSAHVMADWFTGSGFQSALNLIATSEKYNKETMGAKEKLIAFDLEKIQKLNIGSFISFDMQVIATYEALTTDGIVESLASLKPELDKEGIAKAYKSLMGQQQPRRCLKVEYIPTRVYVNGKKSSSMKNLLSSQEIGPDIYLNKTFGK